ncbi:MAG: carbohydrate-binding protein [Acidobacteriota bacterium]
MAKAEIESGVITTPVPLKKNSTVHVIYSGMLSDHGADQVYMHSGYGASHDWYWVNEQAMDRNRWGWEAVVDIHGDHRFNFCFRDSADHWDNNSGHNWSYEIQGQ